MTERDMAAVPDASNPVHQQYLRLRAAFGEGVLREADGSAGPGACLRPLLSALGWRGEARHLYEAMPHFEDVVDIDDVREVLARLNYVTRASRMRLADIGEDHLPCLFARPDGTICVIVARDGNELTVFNPVTKAWETLPCSRRRGIAYLVSEIDVEKEIGHRNTVGWMAAMASRFKGTAAVLLGLTFVTNLLALAIPLFVMSVYDKVIGTRSVDVLGYFLAGVLFVVAADMCLRAIRARVLAYIGARSEALVIASTFEQIMYLPVSMTERAAIGSQITKLRQFEGIRDVFTGPLAGAILDLPFIVVFLAMIVVFGGPVAWVPVALIAAFVVMGAVTIPLTRHHVAATGEARSRMQDFLIEMASRQRAIHEAGATEVWKERFKTLSGEAVACHMASQRLSFVVQNLTQTMVMLAGIGTLGIGAMQVMDGNMTIGALIAVMAMVWRILAPLQSLFHSLNRLSQVTQTFRQVNQLMRMPVERRPGEVPSFYRWFTGELKLSRVGFRYTPRSEPALAGVSLDIPQGQLVAVTGASGSGKSTLLKILAGLYVPQAGSVRIDGLDLRQLDPGELRHAISYVQQKATFFHGTVEQNLRLAHPTATDREIADALRDAGLGDMDRGVLPEGSRTRITGEVQRMLSDGMKQRLVLARAWVKDAAVYLLDEPANDLDDDADRALLEKLEALRGRSTVVMVTHRPSHMRIADRVICLDRGWVVHDGPPEEVLPLILRNAA